MVTALGNLQISRVARRGENSRSELVVKIGIIRVIGLAPIPIGARSFKHALQLVGSDHEVDFGNLLQNVLAIAFHQTPGHNELLRGA